MNHTPPHFSLFLSVSFSEAGGSILSPPSFSSSSPSSARPAASTPCVDQQQLRGLLGPCLGHDAKPVMSRCEEVDGFHGYQDVFSVCVCGRGREFPWLSLTSSLCVLWAAVLSAVRCDEGVYIAVQKAQGQHNTIPLGSVCLPVWLRGSLADRFVYLTE